MAGSQAGGAAPAANAKDLLVLYGYNEVNVGDDSESGRGSWD